MCGSFCVLIPTLRREIYSNLLERVLKMLKNTNEINLLASMQMEFRIEGGVHPSASKTDE